MNYLEKANSVRNQLSEILTGRLKEAVSLDITAGKLEEKARSGRYSEEVNKGYLEEAKKLRKEKKRVAKEYEEEARELIDSTIDEIKRDRLPKLSELSSDADLLRSGLKLTQEEIMLLSEKEENSSPTMRRFVRQFCEENNLQVPEVIVEDELLNEGDEALATLAAYHGILKLILKPTDPIRGTTSWFDTPEAALKFDIANRYFALED